MIASHAVRPAVNADRNEDAAVYAPRLQRRMPDQRTRGSGGALRLLFVRLADDMPLDDWPPARTVAPTFDPAAGGATDTW